MSVNIGTIDGLIQLKDEFTGTIGLAKASLSNFTKQNQESLKAIAGFAGLAGAAFAAVATTVVALGNRGSDVNDLRATVEQFTGGARQADAAIAALRAGTLGTVDTFTLMSKAAHLTSAGVKLTTAEFKLLGSAASVLSDRGLGSVTQQLDVVSDAMVSGRTKALALQLGVIDVGDAEENYAATLGTTAEFLSERGKVEAHRIEVMRILGAAVKDAGVAERDFGDQLKAGRVLVVDWVDKVAGAIAKSDVFAKGMKTLGDAVARAFGGDAGEGIATAVTFIEKGAIATVGFGIAAVEATRVVHALWSGVEAVALSITTLVTWTATGLAGIFTAAATGMEKLNLLPKGTAAAMEDTRVVLRAMTDDLAKQVDEAAKGVLGTSAFDKTLDELGGTLFHVRDAMKGATTATEAGNEATDRATTITANNVAQLAKLGERLLDNKKIQDAITEQIKKETPEIAKLYADLAATRIAQSGSSADAERAQIEATFQAAAAALDKTIAGLDKANPLYAEHYKALRDTADLALKGVGSAWGEVKDKSLSALREQAKAFREAYNQMQTGGQQFARETLEEMREKTEKAEWAAKGMGTAYVSAADAAAAALGKAADEAQRLKDQAAEAAKKAEALRAGGSFEVTRANFETTMRGMGHEGAGDVEKLLRQGYSFQQALLWSKHPDWAPPESIGPRVPGFASGVTNFSGGLARVHGGEMLVNLPKGTDVVPRGAGGGGVSTVNVHMNLNGILVGNSPAARTEFAQFTGKAITDHLLARGWRPPLNARR